MLLESNEREREIEAAFLLYLQKRGRTHERTRERRRSLFFFATKRKRSVFERVPAYLEPSANEFSRRVHVPAVEDLRARESENAAVAEVLMRRQQQATMQTFRTTSAMRIAVLLVACLGE